jgi:CBS domain containing-hemolysin-like protein
MAMFAGLMSGMTVGLMAIDELNLKLKLESGTDEEKIHAKRILPLLKDHHLLLVTLLLANAISLETLPLILELMVGGFFSIIISVLLTLFLAEVIPQAVCLGPNQIPIASAVSKFIKLLILVLWPISYPLARLLDRIIGHNQNKVYNDEELKTFFTMQLINKSTCLEPIYEAQVGIIHRVIDFKRTSIEDLYTEKGRVFEINDRMVLNEENLEIIAAKGFSRMPVRNEKGVWVGVLKTKLLLDVENGTKVSDLALKSPLYVHYKENIYSLLTLFSQGNSHMAFVLNDNKDVLGVITLKSILKQFIKRQNFFRNSLSIAETENDIFEKPSERIFTKIFHKLQRNSHKNQTFISEFQLVEKQNLKAPLK